MSKRTVLVCDNCGLEIENGNGAQVRVTYSDSRRNSTQADFCITCAEKLPGHSTARRGRPPKVAVPA